MASQELVDVIKAGLNHVKYETIVNVSHKNCSAFVPDVLIHVAGAIPLDGEHERDAQLSPPSVFKPTEILLEHDDIGGNIHALGRVQIDWSINVSLRVGKIEIYGLGFEVV